jgi:CRP-like cAMP-binding protein
MDASFLLLPDAQCSPSHKSARTSANIAASDALIEPEMHVRRFAMRQRIFSAGDQATSIYEVAQGSVFLSHYLADGRRQIVNIVGPGRLFGFADQQHDCSAEAATSTVICSLDRDAAQASLAISRRMKRAMIEEISDLRAMAVLLGRKEAIERVATFLCALATSDAKAGARLRIPFTRGEIADYLGLTEETVCRSISRLKKLGLVDIPAATDFVLLNPQALRALAQGEGVQA